jgi:4-amino-4-deoxy-L-arabinose transferase-like glycosyltransferase
MREERPATEERPGSSSDWRRRLEPHRWPGAVLVYSLVAGLVCFWRLGATGLVSMEGIVVDGARHMLASGDWLVPRLYGEIYTYKPAFAYWLASIPLRLADPPSEALLRLPFAATGFLMGLAVLILIGRVSSWRAGLLSSLASVTGVLFLQKARMAEFDIPLAASVGVAVAAACYNLSTSRQRWAVWLLGYVALAAGFLSKGPPALMFFGPGILVAAAACGRFRRLFGWRHLSAALVFMAITGSYLWAVWESAGPAAFRQPVVESRIRGLGGWTLEPDDELLSLPEASWVSRAGDDFGQGWSRALVLSVVKPVGLWASFLPWTILLLSFSRSAGPVAAPRPFWRLGS